MSKLCFKNIKKINNFEKNLVYGYVRIIQKLIEYQIPYVINGICLLFFYEMDQFGKTKVSNDDERIKKRCSIFGTMNIMHTEYSSNFLYQWKFKFGTKTEGVLIGITNSTTVHWFESRYEHHIGLSSCGMILKTENPSKTCPEEHYVGNYCTPIAEEFALTPNNTGPNRKQCILPNDEIIISMDVKEKLMEYAIRSHGCRKFKYGMTGIPIIFERKDDKYRIAVAYLCETGMDIELIAFNKIVRTSGKIKAKESILHQIIRNQRKNKIKHY